jgi:hypothetical protein
LDSTVVDVVVVLTDYALEASVYPDDWVSLFSSVEAAGADYSKCNLLPDTCAIKANIKSIAKSWAFNMIRF